MRQQPRYKKPPPNRKVPVQTIVIKPQKNQFNWFDALCWLILIGAVYLAVTEIIYSPNPFQLVENGPIEFTVEDTGVEPQIINPLENQNQNQRGSEGNPRQSTDQSQRSAEPAPLMPTRTPAPQATVTPLPTNRPPSDNARGRCSDRTVDCSQALPTATTIMQRQG